MTDYHFSVFPFGKYKGIKIENLPLTYVVYALEEFNLPKDLIADLEQTLVDRLKLSYLSEDLVFNVCVELNCRQVFKEIAKRLGYE